MTPFKIHQFEIYIATFENATDSEQQGKRPVVIVQNDKGNLHSPTTIDIFTSILSAFLTFFQYQQNLPYKRKWH
jgi:mRNA-degrading endonuclease toxin of MazEF toxin-antitoxin module